MSDNPLNVYKKIKRISETPRETEARVLTQGAIKLTRCLDAWEEKGRRRMLHDALTYNQKIWTLFQSELSNPENQQQPLEIRKNLLSLSVFIIKKIRSAMIDPTRAKLDTIININMNIAQGLGVSPKAGSTEDRESL
jgi:flagellar biosynthesis activator protein FlaF